MYALHSQAKVSRILSSLSSHPSFHLSSSSFLNLSHILYSLYTFSVGTHIDARPDAPPCLSPFSGPRARSLSEGHADASNAARGRRTAATRRHRTAALLSAGSEPVGTPRGDHGWQGWFSVARRRRRGPADGRELNRRELGQGDVQRGEVEIPGAVVLRSRQRMDHHHQRRQQQQQRARRHLEVEKIDKM